MYRLLVKVGTFEETVSEAQKKVRTILLETERKGWTLWDNGRQVSNTVTCNNMESRKWLHEPSEQAKVISTQNVEGATWFLSTYSKMWEESDKLMEDLLNKKKLVLWL